MGTASSDDTTSGTHMATVQDALDEVMSTLEAHAAHCTMIFVPAVATPAPGTGSTPTGAVCDDGTSTSNAARTWHAQGSSVAVECDNPVCKYMASLVLPVSVSVAAAGPARCCGCTVAPHGVARHSHDRNECETLSSIDTVNAVVGDAAMDASAQHPPLAWWACPGLEDAGANAHPHRPLHLPIVGPLHDPGTSGVRHVHLWRPAKGRLYLELQLRHVGDLRIRHGKPGE